MDGPGLLFCKESPFGKNEGRGQPQMVCYRASAAVFTGANRQHWDLPKDSARNLS